MTLLEAMETALSVAEEARREWDEAPSGMYAGKLLIALTDPTLHYRADITGMHAAVAAARVEAAAPTLLAAVEAYAKDSFLPEHGYLSSMLSDALALARTGRARP